MTEMPRDLPTLLADLQPLEGAFSPVVRIADEASRGIHLSRLTDHDLNRLMADAILEEPGGDAKLAAAYLMGIVSWAVCEGLCGLALRGQWLAAARPDAIRLHQRFAKWEEDGEKGVCLAFDIDIDTDGVAFVDFEAHAGLAISLEHILTPLVDALYRASGLGRAALWRLVSDSLAAAFKEHGKALQDVEGAIAHARQILRDRGSKLWNKQTDFEWIALPERPEVGDWMRVRGGCCRYYTARQEDAEYCTTCVLRSAESRRDRYRAYLRRTHQMH